MIRTSQPITESESEITRQIGFTESDATFGAITDQSLIAC